jgi:hypothetical protein
MPENTFYKIQFTPEECEECYAWFEAHMQQLPPSFQLTPAMYIPDLPACVRMYVKKLRKQMRDNTSYSGQFSVLLMLRQRLQQLPEFQD